MLGVAIELLAGRYVATAYNDRERVEWPPHPARLFSALVSTWADWEPDTDCGQQELMALRWLEEQAPPEIYASALRAAGERDVVPVFVPVNDAAVVSSPDRDKLDVALAALLDAATPKAREKLEKEIAKLQQKLADDTQRAIGVPAKTGKGDGAAGQRLLPERRSRQPRTFPSASPEVPVFAFVWPDAECSPGDRAALTRLLHRLVRMGHSSTFVSARLCESDVIASLASRTSHFRPDEERGDTVIRWVSPGQVDRLTQAFILHQETEPRVLPARFVPYAEGARQQGNPSARTLFEDDFIVLSRVGGPRLPSTSVAGVSRQIRRALMSCAEQPVAELLSGHQSSGEALTRPHLAILPLPSVGYEHADGALLGVALVLPSAVEDSERRAVLRALGELERRNRTSDALEVPVIPIKLGDAGVLELQRVAWGEAPSTTLRPRWWTRSSRRWASATPVALDRNPGDLHDSNPERRAAAFAEAAAIVREATLRVFPQGSVDLVEIDVIRSAVLPGSAKPRSFPRFPMDSHRPQRVLVHVRLVFSQPVRGPLMLGAGRYQGLGLCLPVDDRDAPAREDSP